MGASTSVLLWGWCQDSCGERSGCPPDTAIGTPMAQVGTRAGAPHHHILPGGPLPLLPRHVGGSPKHLQLRRTELVGRGSIMRRGHCCMAGAPQGPCPASPPLPITGDLAQARGGAGGSALELPSSCNHGKQGNTKSWGTTRICFKNAFIALERGSHL